MQVLNSHASPLGAEPALQLPQRAAPSVVQDTAVAAAPSAYMRAHAAGAELKRIASQGEACVETTSRSYTIGSARRSSRRRTIGAHASVELLRIDVWPHQGDTSIATTTKICTIGSLGHPVAAAPSAHMQVPNSPALPLRVKPAWQLP